MKLRLLFFTSMLLLLGVDMFAQLHYLPLNRQAAIKIEAQLYQKNSHEHTTVKPLLIPSIILDSLNNDSTIKKKYWLGRKLFQEDLINIDSTDYSLRINPVFNFEYNRDIVDTAYLGLLYTNTRGFCVNGNIGKSFSFESSFYENQSVFPNYLSEFTTKYQVVPGQGRIKPFKTTGFDYAMASGYVSYSPKSNLTVTFGQGKNFIGEGYRSLMLSDNTFNYPFLKTSTFFLNKRLQYTSISTSFQSLVRSNFANTPEALFVRKAGSFHYLSFNVSRNLQLGLFEGFIWKTSENNYPKSRNILFYNPIILVNSAILAKDTINNFVNGLNLKYIPYKQFALYSQFIINGLNPERIGYQVGFKYFNAFNIKQLSLQAEYNNVKTYTYTSNETIQSYSHYNQPIAHPSGAGFSEIVSIANYNLKNVYFQYKLNSINTFRNSQNRGYDILVSSKPSSSSELKSEKTTIIYNDFQLGYIMNQKNQMMLIAGFTYRNNSFEERTNQLIYLSFKTSLSNHYYDF